MKIIYATALALTLTVTAFAQKNDGTTKSLINTETNFEKAVAKDGDKEAFLDFALPTALVFRPNPVNVKTFYNGQTKGDKNITWEPNFAKVSRSGDLGFTTGEYAINGVDKKYGQYLSIWKTEGGNWKLAIDLGTESNKPLKRLANRFEEPKDHYVPKYTTEKEVKASKEIISTTEKTLNAMLKTHGIAAFSGFITSNSRLIFPGSEAIEGKNNVLLFYNNMVSKINLKTTAVDKALGSDLAYSFGVATIDYKTDLRESFNYVFIYEKAEDSTWNIIMQAYVPADR